MANYYGTTRTNYFHVKDADAFRSFMSKVVVDEDSIHLWEDTDRDGNLVFGFGCYGSILGLPPEDVDDENDFDFDFDYDEFIDKLSEHLVKGDAAIIVEIGNEKLRYLTGSAMIVTENDSEYLDINVMAAERAAQMLGNNTWTTKLAY